MDTERQTILITGAASGIGEAVARRFAAGGWNVAASMRDPARAGSWAQTPNVIAPALDVTDRDSIARGVAEVRARFGRIDVLVNNAGYALNGPLEGATDEQMRHQFDVNLFGLVDVTRAVLPGMRAAGRGLVMNMSSIGGLIGMPVSPFYIASKHAVEGLSESMRFELRPFGVRVKLIEPGGVRTDFISRSSRWTDHPDYGPQIAAAKAMASALDANLAKPEDVAEVVWRAVNDRSDRLRYLAKPGPYVALYRSLPDRVWRGMIQGALSRQARPR